MCLNAMSRLLHGTARNPRIEIHALLSGGVKIQTDADFQRMQYQRGGSENYILAHTQYGHMRLCVFTGSVFQANACSRSIQRRGTVRITESCLLSNLYPKITGIRSSNASSICI